MFIYKIPRPPPLVWQAHSYAEDTVELLEIDVRRSRMNALMHSAHEFSVFCAFDSIVRSTTGILGDFSFVSVRPGKRSALSMLPYVGPMFYHRVAVEHMLHFAIITWDDIYWSLSSSGKLPASSFKGPIEAMEDAWGDNRALAKHSIISMIGLWAISSSHHIFHAKTLNDTSDATGSLLRRPVAFGNNETIYDHVFVTKVLSNTSLRPIHDQVMHTEATRMAQVFFILTSLGIPQRCIKDVKTDAFIMEKSPGNERLSWNIFPMLLSRTSPTYGGNTRKSTTIKLS